jgi:SNF2 family DNA or RNA helicase
MDLSESALHRHILLPSDFSGPVLVEACVPEGELFLLRVRTADGRVEEVTVEREELEAALARAEETHVGLVAASDLFMLIESSRIRLAYAYDPYFAVSLSGVEALPHQLEAVYERMLPQARLRFLLADDPGAGKTIMAGLLIKELKLRGAIERTLILAPAPLTIQWQDEMQSKFDEVFERIRSDLARDQLAGNVWSRFPQCITSIDFAKQPDVWPGLLQADWDLVVIDEAHKCPARTFGDEVKRTRRYELAERLSENCERLLLLTATPHSGAVDQFGHFLRLLDGIDRRDASPNRTQHQVLTLEGCPWFLRRMKEELRDFDGRLLFTKRHPVTQPFELTPPELRLYNEVTQYINLFLPRQAGGRRRMSVALARTVLQRRLASSLRAIRRSLERRHERFDGIVREIEGLSADQQRRRLLELGLLQVDDEVETDDEDEELFEFAATTISAAERIDDLRHEVTELARLTQLARDTEAVGEESKLQALEACLRRAEFAELRDGRGKLLVFTEHRDTLDYLREKLQGWGYTTCEIHGGMDAQRRRQEQLTFQRDV